jgi:DNA segregation ATPase FtsK/SpoIIIE, S-DNA-T family
LDISKYIDSGVLFLYITDAGVTREGGHMDTQKAGMRLRGLLQTLVPMRRHWERPDLSLLTGLSTEDASRETSFEPPVEAARVVAVLERYGVRGQVSDFRIGPSVTTYEVEVPVGTRLASLERFRDDIARDLRVTSLRIAKSVSAGSAIGLEVENGQRLPVDFRAMACGVPEGMALPVVLGEDTHGRTMYRDLAAMPHLLVAGQTGSGKSVFMCSLLATLCALRGPDELRLKLVDPKQVEFAEFEGDLHVDGKIAHEPQEARRLLSDAVHEMERRFVLLRNRRCRKLSDYNECVQDHEKLPRIVVAVDEFADLMLMGTREERKEVESGIVRIAQKARAVGIHLVLSTQKPLASVVTSLIKANMPARAAFSVSSSTDSRVVLDESGAEMLAGCGDMLYRDPNARLESEKLTRVQAPWVSDKDLRLLLGSSS